MIEETIQRIEARLQAAENLAPERRDELLQLLATLQREAAELSRTHANHAASLAGFAEASTHAATQAEPDAGELRASLDGMAKSVEGFEASHPRLVQTVSAITHTLSNLGI